MTALALSPSALLSSEITPVYQIPNLTNGYHLPTACSPDMSDRYVNIDSNEIIARMADDGFQVAAVTRNGHRTSKGFYARHQIDFRRPSDFNLDPEVAPRILFTNSHDGSTRARLTAGLIRWICSNGLIAGDILSDHKVTHIGLQATQLIERVKDLSKDSLLAFEQIERMRLTVMSKSETTLLAEQAGILRFGNAGADYDPMLIAAPRRMEDVKQDLWTVFNRIQENAIRGGLPTRPEASPRRSRPITNIDKNMELNRGLWDLAMSFAK